MSETYTLTLIEYNYSLQSFIILLLDILHVSGHIFVVAFKKKQKTKNNQEHQWFSNIGPSDWTSSRSVITLTSQFLQEQIVPPTNASKQKWI